MRKVIWNNDVQKMIDSLGVEPDFDEIVHDPKLSYEMAYEAIDNWHSDEKINLDINIDSNIICLAEIQLWNGRVSGYKRLNSNNISNILDAIHTDGSIEYYVEDGEIKAESRGHDNPVTPSKYIFRAWRKNTSEAGRKKVLDAFLNKDSNRWDIANRYTKKLGKYPCKVYGWAA